MLTQPKLIWLSQLLERTFASEVMCHLSFPIKRLE